MGSPSCVSESWVPFWASRNSTVTSVSALSALGPSHLRVKTSISLGRTSRKLPRMREGPLSLPCSWSPSSPPTFSSNSALERLTSSLANHCLSEPPSVQAL